MTLLDKLSLWAMLGLISWGGICESIYIIKYCAIMHK